MCVLLRALLARRNLAISRCMPSWCGPGSLRFLHVVSHWQLGATDINRDPLDPFFGEPTSSMVVAPDRGELQLHPSRVVRFLGNPLPDPMKRSSAARAIQPRTGSTRGMVRRDMFIQRRGAQQLSTLQLGK